MNPGWFRLGPRRLAGLLLGFAGLAAFWAVAATAGVAVGLALLAGVCGAALLTVAVTYLEVRRQHRLGGVRERAFADRWQVLQAELRQLRGSVTRDRDRLGSQMEELARLHQQSVNATAWQAARQVAAGPSPSGGRLIDRPESRDAEVALIREGDLFDPQWYVDRIGIPMPDPVEHYVDYGAALGIDPHPWFVSSRYLERHPDALLRWRTPLGHYLATERDNAGARPAPMVRYNSLGYPDEADLKWEYLARGLHREPDTFVLYRIIGNDLPPRHRSGQSLENLRFVLEHEPELPGCQKRWVINRIIDPRTEKQIIALLEEHGRDYLHIPFRPEEFRQVGWRFSGLEPPGLTYRREFEQLNPNQRQRALDHVYHYKNLYVMNNNGARNAALREGRRFAKWVLPWDGNCFLTAQAWEELVAAVTAAPYLKFFTVPMARVVNNDVLLRPDPVVDATEEPQLLFRRDALTEFNPDARYGRRPKVELFYRLRIPGPWDDWGRVVWDDPPPSPSPEARQVGQASWVARLFSGQQALEADSNDRQWRRIEGIRECIDTVDRELARKLYQPTTLLTRDEAVLERQRARFSDGDIAVSQVVRDLVTLAKQRQRLESGDPRVITDTVLVLALAGWFTPQSRFHAQAAGLIRQQVLAARSPLGWSRRGPRFPLTGAIGIGSLLDAARLLEREGALTTTDADRLRRWSERYRTWLEESPDGAAARASLDQTGTWYDVQAVALAAYLDDIGGMLAALRRSSERIGQQFGAGSQRHQDLFNLTGWVQLGRYAGRLGQELWSAPAPGGQDLTEVLRHRFESAGLGTGEADAVAAEPEPVAVDLDLLAVLVHLTAPQVPSMRVTDLVAERRQDPWRLRQVFDPDRAVPSFWILGSKEEPEAR